VAVATRDVSADLVDAVEQLLPEIRARVDEIEAGRRIPATLVEMLRETGVFRIFVPRALGGFELPPETYVRLTELASTADASTGWALMIAASAGLSSAYLDPAGAREIFDPKSILCGAGLAGPTGTATKVDGGWSVTGRWAFASGCQHATWLMGGAIVLEDEQPRLLEGGRPDVRGFFFPPEDVEIIETWDVVGLIGSGSHDIAVTEAYVPDRRVVSLFNAVSRLSGPLYTIDLFGVLPLGVASVALGNARNAIDTLVDLSRTKVPRGAQKPLREDEVVQIQIAKAEGRLQAARAYLYETLREAWRDACEGKATSTDLKARLRLAASHATHASAEAVDLMYHAGGTSSIRKANALQRCFRDAHVLTQHAMTNEASFGFAARALLDIPTDLQRF
jgi:indole-3-acetate monooxygenase